MPTDTQHILEAAKDILSSVTASITQKMEDISLQHAIRKKRLPEANDDNKLVEERLLAREEHRLRELEALLPSPYFVRCQVSFESGEVEEISFGKFSFSDALIYSWVTPASQLRFQAPGPVSYTRPDGTKKTGTLIQKDQYLITEGTITYLSRESIDTPRELIYQQYFSQQKKGFMLQEIVAQMEAAQDTVIRASHKGPFVISGPAGSGKTTLALHRVAYLAQSPDVSELFRPTDIIVFVQDTGTKDYFSYLLPELGITGVTITTFGEWAMQVLGTETHRYVYRYGATAEEQDLFEYAKHTALTSLQPGQSYYANPYRTLRQVYRSFSPSQQDLFLAQQQTGVLDRFDLTILLELFYAKHGALTIQKEYLQANKNNQVTRKIGRFPITYSLIIFDEFQNYIPEQIRLINSTRDQQLRASMYIGDMAQQTQFGTITDWQETGEIVPEERTVQLQKVYRNTKEILTYISSLEFTVDIDPQVRSGGAVVEHVCSTIAAEIAYIKTLAVEKKGSIGVLLQHVQDVEYYQQALEGISVQVMSMHEAQGVEFEIVCIAGVHEHMWDIAYPVSWKQYEAQKKIIQKDLLYVALTRAIHELHTVGRCTLSSTTHVLFS